MHRCVTHIHLQSSVGYAGRSHNQFILLGFPTWELVLLSISFGGLCNVGTNMSKDYKVWTFLLKIADILYRRYVKTYPDNLTNVRTYSKSTDIFYGIDNICFHYLDLVQINIIYCCLPDQRCVGCVQNMRWLYYSLGQ